MCDVTISQSSDGTDGGDWGSVLQHTTVEHGDEVRAGEVLGVPRGKGKWQGLA